MADSRNPHGSFIWYELLTADPDSAAAFYGDMIGWTAASVGQPGVDYRIFSSGGTQVAGLRKLPDGAGRMGTGWLGYIGVDDVDQAVDGIAAGGGTVHIPAMDVECVGRIALVADPQRVLFYVMRGESGEASTAFAPMKPGHCNWNELSTRDQDGALAFYIGRFGWEKGEVMPMGEMGGYQFINHGGEMIGAVMTAPPETVRKWNFASEFPTSTPPRRRFQALEARWATALSRSWEGHGRSGRTTRRGCPSGSSGPASELSRKGERK